MSQKGQGQASQGSEQAALGHSAEWDRALRRDTRKELPVRGRVNQPRLSQSTERRGWRGWEPLGPAPPPQHRGPASAPSEEPFY